MFFENKLDNKLKKFVLLLCSFNIIFYSGCSDNTTVLQPKNTHTRKQEIKKFPKDVNLLKDVLQKEPNNLHAHRAYQDLLREQGKQVDVIHEYEERLKKDTNSALNHYLLARAMIKESPNLAIREFGESIQKDPNFEWSYLGLSTAYSLKNDNLSAIQTLEKASQQIPDSIEIHTALAKKRYEIGAWRTAMESAEKCVSLDDMAMDCHLLIGNIYMDQSNAERVSTLANSLIEKAPTSPAGYLLMTRLLHKKGKFEEAKEYGKKAIEKGASLPNDVKTSLGL